MHNNDYDNQILTIMDCVDYPRDDAFYVTIVTNFLLILFCTFMLHSLLHSFGLRL